MCDGARRSFSSQRQSCAPCHHAGEGLPSRADQATAFGLMSLCWGLGSLAGPIIGSLSSPCGASAGQGGSLLCGEHGVLATRCAGRGLPQQAQQGAMAEGAFATSAQPHACETHMRFVSWPSAACPRQPCLSCWPLPSRPCASMLTSPAPQALLPALPGGGAAVCSGNCSDNHTPR